MGDPRQSKAWKSSLRHALSQQKVVVEVEVQVDVLEMAPAATGGGGQSVSQSVNQSVSAVQAEGGVGPREEDGRQSKRGHQWPSSKGSSGA